VTLQSICFDATGTLFELKQSVGDVYRRVALEHGVDLPAWRLEDAHRRVLSRAPSRGLEGDGIAARQQAEVEWWFERIRETFQATDSTVRFEDFQTFAGALFDAYRGAETWRLRPGVVESLALLRDQEWPLAIISNFDHRLPDILEVLGISDYFTVISIPSESGATKPDRAVFEGVANAMNCALESLVYVGDDAKEVLDVIEGHVSRVFDIHEIENLQTLPTLLTTTATLPPRRGTHPHSRRAKGSDRNE